MLWQAMSILSFASRCTVPRLECLQGPAQDSACSPAHSSNSVHYLWDHCRVPVTQLEAADAHPKPVQVRREVMLQLWMEQTLQNLKFAHHVLCSPHSYLGMFTVLLSILQVSEAVTWHPASVVFAGGQRDCSGHA